MDSEEEIEKIAEKLAHDQGWSKLKALSMSPTGTFLVGISCMFTEFAFVLSSLLLFELI